MFSKRKKQFQEIASRSKCWLHDFKNAANKLRWLQVAPSPVSRSGQKSSKVYSRMLNRETLGHWPFSSVLKRRWFRRGENVSTYRVIISTVVMIALFPIDSFVKIGKDYFPSFLYESELLKEMVVHEMTINVWGEILSTTEERIDCIDAISICKKGMRAKVHQCLSDWILLYSLPTWDHRTRGSSQKTFRFSSATLRVVSYMRLWDFFIFFVGFSSDFDAVGETIATLVRLDAFVFTVTTCLRADGSEKVCSHCQKLHSETFSARLPIAFAQLTQRIRAYVEEAQRSWQFPHYQCMHNLVKPFVRSSAKLRWRCIFHLSSVVSLPYRLNGFRNILTPTWALSMTTIYGSSVVVTGKLVPFWAYLNSMLNCKTSKDTPVQKRRKYIGEVSIHWCSQIYFPWEEIQWFSF